MNIQSLLQKIDDCKKEVLGLLNIPPQYYIHTVYDISKYKWSYSSDEGELTWKYRKGGLDNRRYPSVAFEADEYITFLCYPDYGSDEQLLVFLKSNENKI